MSYEDFVWFVLSEEDKGSDTSLEYWFRCVDLNGDGRLTPDELLVRGGGGGEAVGSGGEAEVALVAGSGVRGAHGRLKLQS